MNLKRMMAAVGIVVGGFGTLNPHPENYEWREIE